jgi:hypothetical protein
MVTRATMRMANMQVVVSGLFGLFKIVTNII